MGIDLKYLSRQIFRKTEEFEYIKKIKKGFWKNWFENINAKYELQ